MIEANRFRLGLFVIIGIIVFIGALFIFGLSEIFTAKAKFITLFDESVQGLEAGSPVKYKGAVIGSVSKVTIRIKDKLIRVEMDINPENLSMDTDEQRYWRTRFYNFFRQELKLGLRCRLAYAGITGMKYVDLDYYPADNANADKIKPLPDKGNDFLYIPSQPSVFNDMLTLVSRSLEKISKIKFEKISEELSVTIKGLQKLIDNPKLVKTIEQLERISANIEKGTAEFRNIFTEKEMRTVINHWHRTLDSINQLLISSKKQLEDAEVKETSAEFRKAAAALVSLKASMNESLKKFDLMLDSVTELSRYIESDPSSVIRGKSETPLKFPLDKTTQE
ncbi:MAG: MlaD family protein [Victivallaceae bacterium]|nr:MlaD family protein [Victivallaceae bacterium]